MCSGWDPRLRQPTDQQQLAQMPGVRPVGLGTLLGPAQPARLRRLGEMHPGTDPLELLDHEPPARSRLQRDLELAPREPRQEPPDRDPVSRRDPPAREPAGRQIDPLRSDLSPVLIEPHHDRQPASPVPLLPQLQPEQGPRRAQRPAQPNAYREPRSVLYSRWPAARPISARARPKPFDAEDRPPSPRPHTYLDMPSFPCIVFEALIYQVPAPSALVVMHAASAARSNRGTRYMWRVECTPIPTRSRPPPASRD